MTTDLHAFGAQRAKIVPGEALASGGWSGRNRDAAEFAEIGQELQAPGVRDVDQALLDSINCPCSFFRRRQRILGGVQGARPVPQEHRDRLLRGVPNAEFDLIGPE